jgi:hypothetical protein
VAGITLEDFDTNDQRMIHITVGEQFRISSSDDGLRELEASLVEMALPAPGVYLFKRPDGMYYANHEIRADGWHRVYSSDLPDGRFVGPWTPPAERAYLADEEGTEQLAMFGEVYPTHRMGEDFKDGIREFVFVARSSLG